MPTTQKMRALNQQRTVGNQTNPKLMLYGQFSGQYYTPSTAYPMPTLFIDYLSKAELIKVIRFVTQLEMGYEIVTDEETD